MRVALADLGLETLFVVYPGPRRFDLDDKITALPLTQLVGVKSIGGVSVLNG